MASQGAAENSTSRLGELRMRFQQKTQQEQEQRRRELSTARAAATQTTVVDGQRGATQPSAASNRPVGNGKVRQMFDERRRGAGIDRSNPLRPIGPATTTTSERRTPPRAVGGPAAANSRLAGARVQQQQLSKGISSISLNERPVTADKRAANDSNNNRKYTAPGTVGTGSRLKPVITKKSPPGTASLGSTMRSASTPLTSARMGNRLTGGEEQQQRSARAPPYKGHAKSPVTKTKMSQAAPAAAGQGQAPEGTSKCRHCGRSFVTERLKKHETVCQRTLATKRKIFDASKQRAKGTDTEKYQGKKGQTGGMHRSQSTYSSAAQQIGLKTGVKKNNWRQKHEEFIQSIRAAKQVQAHLARGGKLSDLPPPPPSENPDYIQCPHCGRRFNQQAAERHIPRCATMVHNKPRKDGPPPIKKR